MSIHTDQGPPLPNKYMPLLQFLSAGMKDKQAVEIVYLLKPILENEEETLKLIYLLESL